MRERVLSLVQALALIRAQATDEDRLAAATVVLAGGSTIHDLRRQVDTFWRDLVV